MKNEHHHLPSRRQIWIAAIAAPTALWISQPPVGFWPLAFVAVVPWIYLAVGLASSASGVPKRVYAVVWLPSVLYWLVSLQGLRLAHPLMFIPWILFACYLAFYHVLFVVALGRFQARRVPLIVGAPIAWVGLECIRNYLLTGISVLMLGHHVADVPRIIQIADLFGTYGVSFVLVMANVAIWSLLSGRRGQRSSTPLLASWIAAALALIMTIIYGNFRIGQPLGDDLATFALIQRSEPIEYDQPVERANEIFVAYARQSIGAIGGSNKPIDAVVWPESMFTADTPWRFAEPGASLPAEFEGSKSEFLDILRSHQSYFAERANYVLSAIEASRPTARRPAFLAGCAVIRYADQPEVYSGFIQVAPDGTLTDWYGKTHLVMFGEYIPIAPYVPGLRLLVPPGMGLAVGPAQNDSRSATRRSLQISVSKQPSNESWSINSDPSTTNRFPTSSLRSRTMVGLTIPA